MTQLMINLFKLQSIKSMLGIIIQHSKVVFLNRNVEPLFGSYFLLNSAAIKRKMSFAQNQKSCPLRCKAQFLTCSKGVFFLLCTCLFLSPSFAQNDKADLYNLENSSEFASYLYKSQQFDLAAIEYERILFMQAQNDSLQFQLLSSYSLAGQPKRMIERAESMYPVVKQFPIPIAKLYTKDAFTSGLFFKLADFTQAHSPLPKRDRLFLHLHMQMMQFNWETAELSLNQLGSISKEPLSSASLIIEAGKNQKYKSPALAATLSTLLPGTGKIYTGDWKDALFGLLILGGNAYASYRGFKNKGIQSVQGWTFGIIGFGFYLANIFGSHKAAKRYNTSAQTNLRMQIDENFKLNY